MCFELKSINGWRRPPLVLLAGPNRAGKPPFINRFLRERAEAFPFVHPDEASLSRWERETEREGSARHA